MARNPNTFPDIAAIFATILAQGGEGTYTLPTAPAAVAWRQRAHAYRKALRAKAEETCRPGEAASTPYDGFILKLEGNVVRIETVSSSGVLKIHGKPTVPVAPPPPPARGGEVKDIYQQEAEDLLGKLS